MNVKITTEKKVDCKAGEMTVTISGYLYDIEAFESLVLATEKITGELEAWSNEFPFDEEEDEDKDN